MGTAQKDLEAIRGEESVVLSGTESNPDISLDTTVMEPFMPTAIESSPGNAEDANQAEIASLQKVFCEALLDQLLQEVTEMYREKQPIARLMGFRRLPGLARNDDSLDVAAEVMHRVLDKHREFISEAVLRLVRTLPEDITTTIPPFVEMIMAKMRPCIEGIFDEVVRKERSPTKEDQGGQSDSQIHAA